MLSTSHARLVGAIVVAVVAVTAGGIALGTGEAGARVMPTVLEDDALALFNPQQLPRFTATLRWLGVDVLRVSAEWKLEAPDPDSSVPPPGFPFGDPAAYTSPGMRLLDRAVRAAAAAGLEVMIDPAFSAPRWATSAGGRPLPFTTGWYRRNIDVGELATWEAMLARRYSGHFVPTGSTRPLPRVRIFTLWNEPNGPSFLQPQWQDGVAASADWERRVVDAAYPAIKRIQPRATVLIGNTSDVGAGPEAAAGVPPLDFVRRLACVDARMAPITSGACAHFHTVPADGFAHHPYERDAPPWATSTPAEAGWAQMGDVPALQALLDRLVALHRLTPGAENLWLTEQGYESNAQLTDRPWTERQQADFNAISEYLAWRDDHVVSFSQFLLRDTRTAETLALRARTGNASAELSGTWTTGLERQNGSPKPALSMFRSPVVARIISRRFPRPVAAPLSLSPFPAPADLIEVWGRTRPITAPTLVQVQSSGPGPPAFGVIRDATTDRNGIFDVRVALPAVAASAVRFQWLDPAGGWQLSPSVAPASFRAP